MEPALPAWESNTAPPVRRPILKPTFAPPPQNAPVARVHDVQTTKSLNTTNTKNNTTNVDSKRTRTINITEEKRVMEDAAKPFVQSYGQHYGQQFGHPMILNIMNPIHPAFLTPPPPRSPAMVFPEMNSTKVAEVIQILEALKSLKLSMVPGVTQATAPLLEYFQGQQKPETDPKYRKFVCRCFPLSEGCPADLKEEPLMAMCDSSHSLACCDE